MQAISKLMEVMHKRTPEKKSLETRAHKKEKEYRRLEQELKQVLC